MRLAYRRTGFLSGVNVTYLFNIVNSAFYAKYMIEDGSYGDVDAAEFIEPTGHELAIYHKTTPPAGQQLGTVDGRPGWIDLPPLSADEMVANAEMERQTKINVANAYMSDRQWPGKAAIGRLKGEELARYNLWIDYLDALYVVDTSAAPDIEWPTHPEV